jgi:signal peptidase II
MLYVKRLVALLVVLFATVGCDQATKSLAQTHLATAEPRSFLNGLFWLEYAENSGAFLSLGARIPAEMQHWIFTVAVSVVLTALLIYAIRETFQAASRTHTLVIIALALFLGGGIGNLIDRLTNNGHVIDFMHIGIGRLRTGIFNVADMALMAGVALLLIYSFRSSTNQPPNGAE